MKLQSLINREKSRSRILREDEKFSADNFVRCGLIDCM